MGERCPYGYDSAYGDSFTGIGLVGYLFCPIGVFRGALFILAAVGPLIPVVPSGPLAMLTWATNGIGLVIAVILIGSEWLARPARQKSRPVSVTSEGKVI